jgi:hypothetical protein
MAARDLMRGEGVANLTLVGTLISVAANSLLNAAAVAAKIEGGITIGSAADAAVQTFLIEGCRPGVCP